MTGSAKKGHNRTSLNLQYKALNTLGEIFAYLNQTLRVNLLNASFLVKEGTNNKRLHIILFTCSSEVGKIFISLQWTQGYLSDEILFTVMSKQLYAIDFSSRIWPLYATKKGE